MQRLVVNKRKSTIDGLSLDFDRRAHEEDRSHVELTVKFISAVSTDRDEIVARLICHP